MSEATNEDRRTRGCSKFGTESEVNDGHVLLYLRDHIYPQQADKAMKRRIRSKATNYMYDQGLDRLLYKVCNGRTQKLNSNKMRTDLERHVLLNDGEKENVVKKLHAGAEGGHLGQMKTLHKVQQRYFWTNMSKDVRDFVSKCHTCQLVNKKFCGRNKEIHPIPIGEPRFFYFVAIDCITNLPESFNGNINIVVVTCKFSKFGFARATQDITAPTIAKFLYELFCTYGWPHILLSDQGREFCNQVLDILVQTIDRRHTSSYHPQTNGQVS